MAHILLDLNQSTWEGTREQLESEDLNALWSMNISNSSEPVESYLYWISVFQNPVLVLKIIVFSLIILLTIGGNLLVIVAVLSSAALRLPTHALIVNLASADLLLGLTVLPISAVREMSRGWTMDATLCSLWTFLDVLCCTASILSLCGISVDRYIGVSRPLTYTSIMTKTRVRILIALIWTLALVISIAPLLGWRDSSQHPETEGECQVNKELGYVIFSACGSFYLPAFVIIVLYYLVYRAAVRHSRFLSEGSRVTQNKVTLRVHMGSNSNGTKSRTSISDGQELNQHSMKGKHLLICDKVALDSLDLKVHRGNVTTKKYNNSVLLINENHEFYKPLPNLMLKITGYQFLSNEYRATAVQFMIDFCLYSKTKLFGFDEYYHDSNCTGCAFEKGSTPSGYRGIAGCDGRPSCREPCEEPGGSVQQGRCISTVTGANSRAVKFKRQKKAAKTLGIVVGAFLLCWFPFFLVLPLDAACLNCHLEIWFEFAFWLGYLNSCLNPFIYACSSRELRRAFRTILCFRSRQSPIRSSSSPSVRFRSSSKPSASLS